VIAVQFPTLSNPYSFRLFQPISFCFQPTSPWFSGVSLKSAILHWPPLTVTRTGLFSVKSSLASEGILTS
jgi:hypothetical protein